MTNYLVRWANGRVAFILAEDEDGLLERIFGFDDEFDTDPRTTYFTGFTGNVTIVFDPPVTTMPHGIDHCPSLWFTRLRHVDPDTEDAPLGYEQARFMRAIAEHAYPSLHSAVADGFNPGTKRATQLLNRDIRQGPGKDWTRLADACNAVWLERWCREYDRYHARRETSAT